MGLFLEDARKRGQDLSEDFLRDLVLNFLIAGRDTTAQALSWTMYCLCTHPAVEAKARREVIEVCGVRGPAYEDMTQLPYLQAVLSEALRLYPSVPMDAKIATNDDVLPDGTFVPRGTVVMYDIYAMGRDTAIWGDDAEKFRPERWLEMNEAPGNYKYPVFNAGPRECLGRRLALVEMKTCLAMLLPALKLKLAVPAEEITLDAQLTIGMGRGLPCFVHCDREKDDFASSNASTTAYSEITANLSEVTALQSEVDQIAAENDDAPVERPETDGRRRRRSSSVPDVGNAQP
jgi:cytochrome P450